MFVDTRGAVGRGSRPRVCRRCNDMRPQQLQRRHGGPGAHDRAVAGDTPSCGPRSPAGDETCRYTSPTGFSGVPPPGPAIPVTETADVGSEPLARARGHRLRRLGADRAVRGEHVGRHAQERSLELVRSTRRRRQQRPSELPGTSVSRAATIPPVHDSAVAAVQPALAQQVEHDLGQRALVGGEHELAQRGRHALVQARGARLAAGLGADVDLDLEVRARRCSSRRRPGRRRPRRRGRRRATRRCRRCGSASAGAGARARTAARATGGPGPSSTAAAAPRGRPAAPPHARRRPPITSPGAVPGDPEHLGSVRDLRLLAVARVEPGAVEAVALGHLVRPAVDPRRARPRRARARRPRPRRAPRRCGRRASARGRRT